MRERFAAVPTAALVDVMDDLGHREQTLPASIRALTPGMRVAGTNIADEVLRAAEEKVATESEIRVAIREGMTPLEAFERYGTF